MKNRFRRTVLYRFALVARMFLRRLPPSLGIAAGAWLGKASFWLLRKEREKTLRHLSSAFGGEKSPEEIATIGETVFRNLGKTVAELVYFPQITRETLDRWVSFEGLHKLDAVLTAGKGGILLVAHFGNWELLARALALKGYKGIIIARKVYDERFDQLLSEIRETEGITFLDRDHSPKEMLQILHQNQFLGILADQDIDSVDGIFVPFFGKEAYTPIAPARFSSATGAPIIPCFIVRTQEGKHRLMVEDPLQIPEGLGKEEGIHRLTFAWMAVTESYIRRYPDHWVWMHRRWKTQKDRLKTEDQRPQTSRVLCLMSLVLCLVTSSVGYAEKTIQAEQEVHAFSFTGYSKEGKREWEVHGDTATLEGDVAKFEKPKLESAGKTALTVTSDQGTYDRQTAKAHLEKNVFAQTSDGATLKTDSLDWHGSSKKLTTDDRVVIEKGAFVSEGKGAEAYPDLKKFELKEEVKVKVAPDIEITSKGPMELDYTRNIAVFRDEVKVVDKEGELLADRMDVTFEPVSNQIREIIATGNVRIKRGESISYSEKAVYDAALKKVTLVGKPKLFIRSEGESLPDDPFLKKGK